MTEQPLDAIPASSTALHCLDGKLLPTQGRTGSAGAYSHSPTCPQPTAAAPWNCCASALSAELAAMKRPHQRARLLQLWTLPCLHPQLWLLSATPSHALLLAHAYTPKAAAATAAPAAATAAATAIVSQDLLLMRIGWYVLLQLTTPFGKPLTCACFCARCCICCHSRCRCSSFCRLSRCSCSYRCLHSSYSCSSSSCSRKQTRPRDNDT